MFFIRMILSLFFTSVGIFWSETLRGFKFLFEYASFVKDFFSTIFNINLPIPKDVDPSYLKTIGIFCVGILTIGLSLIGLDLYFHDLFANIPVLSTIVNWFYVAFTPLAYVYRKVADIINFFRRGGGGGNGPAAFLDEEIKRSTKIQWL
uniref:hypothetical protein n=1 Tax=Porodaedalea niemelaei TaxID=175858 RepID=UPI0023AAC0D1|nr:hypothetical protein P1R16_mgp30 [Porodaedalea niemelaei]WCF76662.1 hypothetical protein [Porodaedalea niemelaei]